MPRHIITIGSKEGPLVDLYVQMNPAMPPTGATWSVDNNLVSLGAERWDEWDDLLGDHKKQKAFLEKIPKFSKKEFKQANDMEGNFQEDHHEEYMQSLIEMKETGGEND